MIKILVTCSFELTIQHNDFNPCINFCVISLDKTHHMTAFSWYHVNLPYGKSPFQKVLDLLISLNILFYFSNNISLVIPLCWSTEELFVPQKMCYIPLTWE